MLRSAFAFHADPKLGYQRMPKQPPGYIHHDKSAGIIAGMAVSIAIMVLVTGLRLSLRFFKAGLRSGADDWVLMPAATLAMMYPILQIVMVTHGGGGKHVWDVTYAEYNLFNSVSIEENVVHHPMLTCSSWE